MRRVLAISLAALVVAGAAAGAATLWKPHWWRHHEPAARVTAERLVDIPLLMPEDDPEGLVILVSEARGISKRDRAFADQLLARNLIVMPVDLEKWRTKLDAEDGECIYLGSDLENLAKEALRTIDGDSYFHPVVAGIGEGGTIAYAALADAPVATLAGAVALEPAPALKTKLPSCPGAASTPAAGGGFSYALDAALPAPGRIVAADEPAGLAPASETGTLQARAIVAPDPGAREKAAVDAIFSMAEKDAASSDLPVVDIPTTGQPIALALFYSGDGGWRDLDKTIGDEMANQGVHVAGIDSLRYFWTEREPQEIADDAVSIIDRLDPTGKLPVAIFGYSFGADTFPFAWPLLPEKIRDRIRFVGLLGTEKTTPFQVTVGGWLGMGGDNPVGPAIAKIPAERVLCVYGEEEEDTVCNEPELASVQKLKLSGGHHFDEDYDALATRLLDELHKRIDAGT